MLTGGDDGVARVWDLSLEGKEPVAEFDDGRDCPVTAVEWSKDGNQAFVGGVDNEVKVWDLRSGKVVYTLHGHTDTVSCSINLDWAGTGWAGLDGGSGQMENGEERPTNLSRISLRLRERLLDQYEAGRDRDEMTSTPTIHITALFSHLCP